MVKLGSVPAPRQKAGGLPYKRCGCLSHFLGVNKSSFETFDIPWGIKPHKIHSDSFCSTFKGIGPKNRTGNNVLHDRISTSWERKQFQATPTKLDLGTSLGFFLQNFRKTPLVLLAWESPSGTRSNWIYDLGQIKTKNSFFCCPSHFSGNPFLLEN